MDIHTIQLHNLTDLGHLLLNVLDNDFKSGSFKEPRSNVCKRLTDKVSYCVFSTAVARKI